MAIVFDVFVDHLAAVMNARFTTGDGGHARDTGCRRGGGGRAGDLHQLDIGQVLREPVAALRERLRLAMHLANFGPAAGTQ